MGSLRIIAGELKGRRIRVPRGDRVRPTAERAREGLFSILGETVVGARILDAYAGSGALGFEALSRGAREVSFVESDAGTARLLEEACRALGVAARCRVVRGETVPLLRTGALPAPFDLVFADPPWSSDEISTLFPRIAVSGVLAPDGLLIVEREARRTPERPGSEGLSLIRTVRYGDTVLDFYSGAPAG